MLKGGGRETPAALMLNQETEMANKHHTIIVKSKSPRGFRRAGIGFSREARELRVADLTAEQLEAIRAEHGRNLIVSESDEPAADTKTDQIVLVGSDKLPSEILIVEGTVAPSADIVAIAFAAAAQRAELAVITAADWNAETFAAQREELLQSTVDALQANPAIYQAFLDERSKVATTPKAADKNATAKAAGKQGKGAK